jgi:hypothetical protein
VLAIEAVKITIAAAAAAVVIAAAVESGIETCPGGPPPSGPTYTPVSVTVAYDSVSLANNVMLNNITRGLVKTTVHPSSYKTALNNNNPPYDLLKVGDQLLFVLQFYGGYPVKDDATSPWVNLFDPVFSEYSNLLHIISVAKTNVTADRCLLTIKKDIAGPIREENGAGQAIIRFGCDIVINNSTTGVEFVNDTNTTVSQHRNDVFIININTKPPEP